MFIGQPWKPREIIIHTKVKDDPVTLYIKGQCPEVPTTFVSNGTPTSVVQASNVLTKRSNSMLDKIIAGKKVLFIAPASNDTVDTFSMPDDRILCPHFNRLKMCSNGCFYQCDWCYLKGTYRAQQPYITVRVEYDKIIDQIKKKIESSAGPIMFNSGELADSLSLEHLTGAAGTLIPMFGSTENGYLFMLTKSDNVEGILDLQHNGHTIFALSINNTYVSRKFEIGAPSFERRLTAAKKVQEAGYPIRIRLDPIVPLSGWKNEYAVTVRRIFEEVSPERLTLGTLRFEKQFYNMRNKIITSGPDLLDFMESMEPMFEPKMFPNKTHPSTGKYSFTDDRRVEIFNFIIGEIRKHSDCKIALCKESAEVWDKVGLDLSNCSCVCQLNYSDMTVENHI